jgi:hypothetical protein
MRRESKRLSFEGNFIASPVIGFGHDAAKDRLAYAAISQSWVDSDKTGSLSDHQGKQADCVSHSDRLTRLNKLEGIPRFFQHCLILDRNLSWASILLA